MGELPEGQFFRTQREAGQGLATVLDVYGRLCHRLPQKKMPIPGGKSDNN